MSTIEIAPQKSKEFSNRKQDHGDAAEQRGHRWVRLYKNEVKDGLYADIKSEKDTEHLKSALDDTSVDYAAMSFAKRSAALEAAANKILNDNDSELVYSTMATPDQEQPDIEDYTSVIEDDLREGVNLKTTGFTEADFGVKSKHEIGREMARRVQIDVAFEDDDNGDSDYGSPIRVKNRL